jgi:hypothetical protein
LRFTGQLKSLEARNQLLEQNAHLQVSEVLAEASVNACTERDMPGRIAIDPKALRLIKQGLIVVRRKIRQHSDTWQLVINTGTTIVTFLIMSASPPATDIARREVTSILLHVRRWLHQSGHTSIPFMKMNGIR